MLAVDLFTDVAEGELGRTLSADGLVETRHEEVVRELLDATYWELRAFAAERAGELAVVAVLLVGAFGLHVVLDALLAEGVEAVETLGTLVALQADLADQELVVDLLRELTSGGRHDT